MVERDLKAARWKWIEEAEDSDECWQRIQSKFYDTAITMGCMRILTAFVTASLSTWAEPAFS
jgi:hypothetical protein